jgi:hypothetical protein
MRSITYAYHDLVNEKTTARESGATMSEYHNDGDNHDHHCSKREQEDTPRRSALSFRCHSANFACAASLAHFSSSSGLLVEASPTIVRPSVIRYLLSRLLITVQAYAIAKVHSDVSGSPGCWFVKVETSASEPSKNPLLLCRGDRIGQGNVVGATLMPVFLYSLGRESLASIEP